MESFQSEYDVPLGETVVFCGPQDEAAESETGESKTRDTAVKTLNVLARVDPSLVASVLSDWIDSRPNLPR